jgi:hypothetical protein
MMILFAILKIIGIVLLSILCVILVLLALILFVPVVYQADGDSDARTAAVRVRWLFGVFRFSLENTPENGTTYSVRLFGIQLFPRKEKTGRSGQPRKLFRRKHKKTRPELKPDKTDADLYSREAVQTEAPDTDRDAGYTQETEEHPPEEEFFNYSGDEFSGGTDKKQRLSGRASELGSLARRLRDVIRQVRESEVLPLLVPKLKKLLYRCRPRKLTGRIAFGFADPSHTGLLCGGLSLLPVLLSSDLILQPDFETDVTYFRGAVSAGGRIQLIHLLIFLIAMIRRKEVRALIRTIRKAG